MKTPWKRLVWATIILVVLSKSIPYASPNASGDIHIVVQPDLSNNVSIMRNNDDASIEQPTVVSSGYRTDQRYPTDERGLLKFDLSSLPKGYQVKMAVLSLYVIGVYNWDGSSWKPVAELARRIELHAITTNWMGWSFTYWTYATFPKQEWRTPGGDFAPTTGYVKEERPETWSNWTVTEDVRGWYDGTKQNYGWLLKDAEEGARVGCRVEYMDWFYVYDISYAPRLDVTLESKPAFSLCAELIVAAVLVVIVAVITFHRKRLRSQQLTTRKNISTGSGKSYFSGNR